MKNFKDSPFVKEVCETCSNMYRLGWDERNGGNISYIVYEDELKDYDDCHQVIREIPTGFEASELAGLYVLVTGTGKYFKNVAKNPEDDLGLVRIKEDGVTAQLVWGFKDGGKFTSEFSSHLMSHVSRRKIDPENRVVTHSHPQNIMAMTFVSPMDDRDFTRKIWKRNNECILVFPEGVGTLKWMVCGTNEIAKATAEKMKDYRIVVWANHGIYGVGKTLDEAFGLIETVEKSAQCYMMTLAHPIINEITDEDLKQLAAQFNLDYRKDFLD